MVDDLQGVQIVALQSSALDVANEAKDLVRLHRNSTGCNECILGEVTLFVNAKTVGPIIDVRRDRRNYACHRTRFAALR